MCALISISQIYQYSYVKWFNLNCAHNDYVSNFRNMFVFFPYSRVSLFFFFLPFVALSASSAFICSAFFLMFGRWLCFIRWGFSLFSFDHFAIHLQLTANHVVSFECMALKSTFQIVTIAEAERFALIEILVCAAFYKFFDNYLVSVCLCVCIGYILCWTYANDGHIAATSTKLINI